MVDERTTGSPELPNDRNSIKDGTARSQLCQRQITHATTTIVENNRFTTIFTLESRPAKDNSAIVTPTVHRHIFDSITKIDDYAAIIFLDQDCITHSKDILFGDE